MGKHTKEEIIAMTELIEESLRELIFNLFGEGLLDARRLVVAHHHKIVEILEMPYGGTLAPEEIAQMILSQVDYTKHAEEAAAAAAC